MVGKLCSAPAGGGGAGGLVSYLVAYAIAEKGASREEIERAQDAVYGEAEAREDCGVGAIWSPSAGGGTRPSSIFVRNCASFATASMEMDSDALGNPGVKTGAMHFVWSWNAAESGVLTDQQAHQYVGEVLAKLGLGHHRSVAAIHRDTENLHVHCAVGSVDTRTGLALDRTQLYRRMAWAEREVELTHGLGHDHGLAVVRDAGTERARVDWATGPELVAWRAARHEDRVARMERRTFEGYRERDGSFERYADATVGPRFRAALEVAKARGREPAWADLHNVAIRYGCELQRDERGQIVLRDVGIGEMRERHERELRDQIIVFRAAGLDKVEVAERGKQTRALQTVEQSDERERKTSAGDFVPVGALDVDVSRLGEFYDARAAEDRVAAMVERDAALVLRDVTAQSSTFTREDVDLWLAARISDPTEIDRLGDLIVSGGDVRMLSADTMQPLMTTTEVLAIEHQLADDAAALAKTDSGISRGEVKRAIATCEAQQSVTRATEFRLSAEQRGALDLVAGGSLVAMEGLPGTGKTMVMGAIRILADQTGREVVGFALSQAAAERLEDEAGFRCVNTARARILEEKGEEIVPRNGIVVVDEAAMVDSRSQGRLLALARERNCAVVEIGDTRQLQPLDFGASFRIVRDATREAGTYTELRGVQRQRNAWHRDAVIDLADAIVEKDEANRVALVRRALGALEANGAVVWTKDRDSAIDTASMLARAKRAEGVDTILVAGDKDSVRHLGEEVRRLDGLEGGRRYRTDGGTKEFAIGDSLVFRQNSLGRNGIGVRNGDRGEVVATWQERIDVRMDDGRVVHVHPRAYRAIEHGGASTVHSAQGASVGAAVAVIDKSASAELAFVAMSRSRDGLQIVVPRTAFRNLDDLAQHVAKRISLKTTSMTYDELVDRTGGKDTIRVRNIEAQRAAEPLRRIYDAEVAEPARAAREAQIAAERAVYRERLAAIAAEPNLDAEALHDAKRDALRAFRSGAMEAHHASKPAGFSEWLVDRQATRDVVRGAQDRRAERDAERTHVAPGRPSERAAPDRATDRALGREPSPRDEPTSKARAISERAKARVAERAERVADPPARDAPGHER
jgi:hypothetical protein